MKNDRRVARSLIIYQNNLRVKDIKKFEFYARQRTSLFTGGILHVSFTEKRGHITKFVV